MSKVDEREKHAIRNRLRSSLMRRIQKTAGNGNNITTDNHLPTKLPGLARKKTLSMDQVSTQTLVQKTAQFNGRGNETKNMQSLPVPLQKSHNRPKEREATTPIKQSTRTKRAISDSKKQRNACEGSIPRKCSEVSRVNAPWSPRKRAGDSGKKILYSTSNPVKQAVVIDKHEPKEHTKDESLNVGKTILLPEALKQILKKGRPDVTRYSAKTDNSGCKQKSHQMIRRDEEAPKNVLNMASLHTSSINQTASAQTTKEHKMASVQRDDLDLGPTPDSPMMPGSNVNLFCPLCHEMFANPRLLPCLHTFCKRCLENLVPPRSHTLSCPSCRLDVALGERGINGFAPNFVVTTMIDVAAVRNHDQKPILCSSCEEKLPAAARCIECMDFLCYDCRNAHMRLRLTKTHRVVSIEELRSSSHPEDLLHRPIFCSDHGHEKLRYFCESCDQAICRECTMTTHSTANHKYTQLTDTIDKQTNSIQTLVEKLRRKIPAVEQSTKDVEEVTCRLEARAEVAKSEVQKCFPRILKILQDREKSMMNEVESVVRQKSNVLSMQQERLENELKRLSITCTFTEQVLRHGNSVEILVVKKQLCERLNELITAKFQGEPEENDIVYFVANQEDVVRAIEGLGQIKTSQAFPTMCAVADNVNRAFRGKKSLFSVQTRDHLGNPCSGGGEDVLVDVYSADGRTVPAEVEDNRNGTYGVSYTPQSTGMHKVSVTVRDKHIQGSPFKVNVMNPGSDSFVKFGRKGSDIGEFNGIFGVAVDDEGRIIVTDCHNHRVQVFNAQGAFMFQFGRKGEGSGQFQCPTGVGIDPEGRIVVCERLSPRIQIFDRDGMFQQKFHVPDLKASTLAVDENRRIIVADSANRCIHVISLDTGQSFKFGSFGDGNGELSYPCYVAVNPQGHIIVSDMHSHRIQIFDSRGRFLFNFGRKGSQDGELQRPTGVAVMQNGHIIVADRDNHRIQVFSSDGRYFAKFGSKGEGDGQLNDPHGLALTPDGNICIADFRNNRVQVVPGGILLH
ncbi:tripartite motif-containing protein 2 isoform X4 [Nematostella vectensis]|uniref:tripartite motif-containing protein 2 isoform X4 n=1 Tax=Nematostella vectensis TaxID=45351 RepID=UPI0020779831|nr:tripartite motif-containing protein 2 isoform X4 [Nematostella vectensis]